MKYIMLLIASGHFLYTFHYFWAISLQRQNECGHFLYTFHYFWETIYAWKAITEGLKITSAFVISLSFIMDFAIFYSLI